MNVRKLLQNARARKRSKELEPRVAMYPVIIDLALPLRQASLDLSSVTCSLLDDLGNTLSKTTLPAKPETSASEP